MSHSQKTSQTFDRYDCWRPAYEGYALFAWTIGFGYVTWLYLTHRLPLSWCSILTFEELAKIMRGHPNDLWLGIGFRWWPEHSQKLYELMKLDWTKLLLPKWLSNLLLPNQALPNEAAGLPIIHGVSDIDESIFRPLKNFEG